jgi:hypothetical protein
MNIAAVINNLGPSQKSFYLIKEFNKALSATNICASIFFQRSAIPIVPTMFSCRSIAFLSGYHHNTIATTIAEAEITLKANNASRKFLYLWDLEWLRNPNNFTKYCDILRDDRLNIIARSESHAQMIDNFCNKKPIAIIDNWDLETLMGVIKSVENK